MGDYVKFHLVKWQTVCKPVQQGGAWAFIVWYDLIKLYWGNSFGDLLMKKRPFGIQLQNMEFLGVGGLWGCLWVVSHMYLVETYQEWVE